MCTMGYAPLRLLNIFFLSKKMSSKFLSFLSLHKHQKRHIGTIFHKTDIMIEIRKTDIILIHEKHKYCIHGYAYGKVYYTLWVFFPLRMNSVKFLEYAYLYRLAQLYNIKEKESTNNSKWLAVEILTSETWGSLQWSRWHKTGTQLCT